MYRIKRGKYWAIRIGNTYKNPENNNISNLQLFTSHGQHTKIGHPEIAKKCKTLFKNRHLSPKTEWKKNDKRLVGNKFRKGLQAWNKGINWNEKHKQKLKISHMGKHKVNNTSFKKGMIPWNKGIKMIHPE